MSRRFSRGRPFIETEVLEPLIDGVQRGRYHVVLGAGASQGCRNKSGLLPLGSDLARLLLSESGYSDEDVGLPRAYEAAVEKLGRESVTSILRSTFADADPLGWHTQLALLPWEAIWTFNIDDVIEWAYQQATERAQQPQVVVWNEPHVPFGGKTDDVPIVHLHGYVGSYARRDDPQLVFSLEEYLSSLRHADVSNWHTRFRSTFEGEPVIVAGARLNEEVDFAAVVRHGNIAAKWGSPSLIVRPGISEFDRAEYVRWGLTPVDATCEEFFGFLVGAIESQAAETPTSTLFTTRYTNRTFEILPQEEELPADGHDFYAGHEPYWWDVLNDLDAAPPSALEVAKDIGSPHECATVQILYALLGHPFSGTSTALLRIARELHRRGWEPTYLHGHEALSIDDTLSYFADRPQALLVMDGLLHDAYEVAALLREADRRGQRLLILACDRSRYRRHFRNVLPSKMVVGIDSPIIPQTMTQQFWWDIVEKRRARARLGRLEGADRQACLHHFVAHNQDLYSALATLEDAQGFISRGLEVFTELPQQLRTSFAAIALLGRFGLPAPAVLVATTASVSARELLDACEDTGPLFEWIRLDDGQLRLRHRYLGDLLVRGYVDSAHAADLTQIALDICTALSDFVSPRAIQQRTLHYRIARQLMDKEAVQEICGSMNVDGWYAKLEDLYSWNARYWEQRALALSDVMTANALERADSYARRAVTKHRDALSLNTLGTVLMRRIDQAPSRTQAERYWRDAVSALAESREEGRGQYQHPYVTFFSYTKRALDIAAQDENDTWLMAIEGAYTDWYQESRAQGFLADPEILTLVESFPGEWRS